MLFKRKAKRISAKAKSFPVPKAISQKGFGTDMPPHPTLVEIYFAQKGFVKQAKVFYDFYQRSGWRSPKGTPYRNWKLLAGEWMFNYEQEEKLKSRQRINRLVS